MEGTRKWFNSTLGRRKRRDRLKRGKPLRHRGGSLLDTGGDDKRRKMKRQRKKKKLGVRGCTREHKLRCIEKKKRKKENRKTIATARLQRREKGAEENRH